MDDTEDLGPLAEPTPTLSRGDGVPGGPGRSEPGLVPGDRVGRYAVLRRLGAGGMGVVYAAYDPRLDRQVALKLLRRGPSGEESERQARLLREAQSLAKLNDPHVLTIYDAGTVDGQIFLAIEYVDGVDLGRWLAEDRSLAEVLRVFTVAGRGLAAAHRQGLVHRDFKPSNVVVRAADGRALVLDFGLARSAGPPSLAPPASAAAESSSAAAADLTRDGALLGTPLFMAPEQWDGHSDAAADQFSFCASLYLGLYGEPAFGRSSLGMPLGWEVRSAPDGSAVPAWIRRVVVRGLSVEPSERFPSMEALLRALSNDPRRRRRRWLAVAASVATAASAGYFVARAPSPCEGAAARLADVWGVDASRELTAALGGTGEPYAPAVARTVVELVDDYAERWRTGYEDACLATHRRGDQSETVMDLRMGCLDGRRRELGSLLDLLTAEPASMLDRAIPAVGELSPLDACADVASLLAPTPLPEDPDARGQIAELRGELAEAGALRAAGEFSRAAEVGKALAERARAVGYLPVVAEALVGRGMAEEGLAEADASAATFEEAVWVAQASQHDRAGAEALVHLVRVAGHLRQDQPRGLFFADLASSALRRLDRADGLEARLL
ncbi:MAG: serine/threonine-protein kinase, partial [Acidobacteriota bacterium]